MRADVLHRQVSSRSREQSSVLPDPTRSESEHRRFRCEDIPDMTRAAAWAEAQRLRSALVGVVERGPRLFWVDGDAQISDAEWIYGRLRLLAAKLQASSARLSGGAGRFIEGKAR
jgi:hypothetical protein